MHGKYFFLIITLTAVLASPVAGSLTKITAGAPVYLGEQNLDISSGLQQCRIIAWWAPDADTNALPQKNVTIIKTLDDSVIAFKYTISPEIYSGYEGKWYCEGQRPLRTVFEVLKPQISVKFWDLDKSEDVSGRTIPLTSNITYRIDTNLDKALLGKYRPDVTPLDSFYTVSLIDPGNKVLSSVYTGSYGKHDSRGLIFNRNPFISSSPYYWKDGSLWDRTSRNIQGDQIYPPGTYTITVDQNLNTMESSWANAAPDRREGILESSAKITFIRTVPTAVEIATPQLTASPTGTSTATLTTATVHSVVTTIPRKTTYSPLPSVVVLAALGIALACAFRQRI